MKKCPYCAEEIQDQAVVCKHCGRDLAKPAPPPQKESSFSPGCLITLGVSVLLIVFVIILGGLDNDDPDLPDKFSAFVICQDFVKDRLKAPTTAEFPSSSDAAIDENGSMFTVISYVDSENSFGAMIRTNYICTVTYQGNDRWRLSELVFDE